MVDQILAIVLNAAVYWPTYGADYANSRHVNARILTTEDMHRLHPVWSYVLGPHERVETTPIVVGSTMYVTTGTDNNVIALDAATGHEKWRYRPPLGAMSPCCGLLNRGVAVGGNYVYFATLDAQLIALNADTGKPTWHVQIGDGAHGLSETMAPLCWNGIVYIGSSGSDFGIRGSLTAYRASDGKLLWRWYSVGPGWEGDYKTSIFGLSLHRDIAREKRDDRQYRDAWQGGGGAVWMTPALDPHSGTLYVSTGNPAPVFQGWMRPGDNLYTDSIVAIDARTGKMRWGFQQTPHDVWEYEAASPPVLVQASGAGGKRVDAVIEAGKTRWLYVLDRATGKLLRLSQSWSPNRDVYEPGLPNDDNHPLHLRGTIGPIAYDPNSSLAYVTEIDRPTAQTWRDLLVAIDIDNGTIRWKKMLGDVHKSYRGDPVLAGALSVGQLVFAADPMGELTAADARTGQTLWQYRLGTAQTAHVDGNPLIRFVHQVRDFVLPMKRAAFHQHPPTNAPAGVDTSPIAYQVNGRPYVAIGYDSQPERATGAAMITAFSL